MKSKRILWRNNSVLYAEHMNKLCDLIEDGYSYIFTNTNKFNFGILQMQIDELLLSTGVLSINYVQGIFPDGTVFQYDCVDDRYKISLDLTTFSEELFYSAKKFYLVKSHDVIEESKDIVSETEEIVPIVYSSVKLKLSDELNNSSIGFPIAEICIRGGAFNLKEFSPPFLKIVKNSTLGNSISKLILFLRQTILNIRDQLVLNENENLKALLRNLNECLVNINTAFINEFSPFEFYNVLCESIGKISWNSLLMPNIIQYDHNNSYYIIQKLVLLIIEIVTTSRSGYERIEFRRENDVFVAMISEIGEEDILIVIEPNNDDIKKWVENTIIASKSFFEEFQTRRFPGIPREIIDETSAEIVVKLDKFSNYFATGEDLMIFVGNYKNINNISFYFKKYK